MTLKDNSFTIHDNNSQILSILPKEWIEPLVIIAKVEGFDGIDSYVLSLIKDRLEMFIDTRDELGESFKKYMQRIKGLSAEEEEPNKEDENTKEFVNDVQENYHDMKKLEDEDLR